MENEPVTLKQDNLFDLLGSESEKTEPKDLFGGFVDANNTNNDVFNQFTSKITSNVNISLKIIIFNNFKINYFYSGW